MKFISDIKPSAMLNCCVSEAMDKVMEALSSDNKITKLKRDNDNQEIRGIWNLKLNKIIGLGSANGLLIRYSFVESEAGNTMVTATCSRENGKQDFFDIGGVYEKIMRKPFDTIK